MAGFEMATHGRFWVAAEVDIEVSLLDVNQCLVDRFTKSYYRLPEATSPINIDNVDGGNEYWHVVVIPSNKSHIINLSSGIASRHATGQRELRQEWEAAAAGKYIEGFASNYRFRDGPLITGKPIVYESTAVYPHLKEPVIALVPWQEQRGEELKGLQIGVKLPKYFEGRLIPAYVAIEFLDDDTVNVRMVRGAVQKNFVVYISKNPSDVPDLRTK